MHFVNCEKSWIDIFAALLTPIVACFAGWIAYRQWKINKDKLRLDLWKKRFAVYEALRKALEEISRDANISLKGLNQFIINTRVGVFLFNKDVVEYLENIRNKAIRFQSIKRQLSDKNLFVGEKRNKLSCEAEELEYWFESQFMESAQKFKEYLQFD